MLAMSTDLHSAHPPPAPKNAPNRLAIKSKGGKSGHAKNYVVRKGETLSAIARKFGCDVRSIATANNLRAPHYAIHAGQQLNVPSCAATAAR